MGTISNIASAAANATSTSAANSSTNLASNFNTFLNLLTTQLKNQLPSTSSQNGSQFMQQLVEFAGVQQQVQSNTLLQQLVTSSQANQVASASSYIGTTIQATGDEGGLTNGVANFGYTLASTATNVNVSVYDSSGNLVFSGTGPTAAGQNFVKWEGTNSLNGQAEPDGAYTIKVTATDANGNAVTATPFETGVVTSASISNGEVVLNVNGLQIPISDVTSVSNINSGTTVTSTSGSGKSSGSGTTKSSGSGTSSGSGSTKTSSSSSSGTSSGSGTT